MKKKIKKIITGFLTACMVLGASSVTAFANTIDLTENDKSGTTTVEYKVDSSWTASIPAYINPSEQGNADTDKYSVVLSDVMLGNSATLIGTVEYDGKLTDSNDVELGYVLCDEDGEVVTNKEIIFADAGNPDAVTSYKFGAELNENPKYAGNYLGTATFNFAINERVFTIGETKPENVVAKFNTDFSEVEIFTAGNDSDGVMKDFVGNSPMQNQATKLKTASIRNGVTNIGSQAFSECNNLTSVTLSDTVSSISEDAFNECDELSTVCGSYASFAEDWASDNSFNFEPIVYTTEDIETDDHLFGIGETKPEYVVAKFNDDFSEVTIFANGDDSDGKMRDLYPPDNPISKHYSTLQRACLKLGITKIGSNAFQYCTLLTNIDIPESVTEIGYSAFYNCSSLTNINIPDGVAKINDSTFYNCSSLESVQIPDTVMSIGDWAFYCCYKLKNVIIPNRVVSIGERAFNCCRFENIIIPDNVISIGTGAFEACGHLKSVTIPKGVTSIEYATFSKCSSLVDISIPDTVISIGSEAFSECSALVNISIPDTVTSIGSEAFSGCSALVDISIPDTITSIGNSVFENCSSLVDISIPNTVTSIGNRAFYNCSSLANIDIPNSVTKIGSNAFTKCSSLISVNIPENVNKIESYTFYGCSSLTNIYVSENVNSIDSTAFKSCNNLKMVSGHTGSYAETWANSKGYTFVAID